MTTREEQFVAEIKAVMEKYDVLMDDDCEGNYYFRSRNGWDSTILQEDKIFVYVTELPQ